MTRYVYADNLSNVNNQVSDNSDEESMIRIHNALLLIKACSLNFYNMCKRKV